MSAHLLLLLSLAPAAVGAELNGTASQRRCLFEGADLRDQRGHVVGCDVLAGREVALYFAGEWCPLCRRFTPALREFYDKFHESIQIVFVSSDENRRNAEKHFAGAQGDWLALGWEDRLAAELKRKYRVWSGREVQRFGTQRRSGVPCVVVIHADGSEAAFLPGERFGAVALYEWEPTKQNAWPDEL
jgi:nucleoredoxin